MERFGHDAVATALLAKWLSDPDAGEKWERLAAVVAVTRPPRFTPAEADVLTMRARGLTGAQIAQERGTSAETVKTQTKAARERVGARNAAHAVAIGIRSGEVKPPPRAPRADLGALARECLPTPAQIERERHGTADAAERERYGL